LFAGLRFPREVIVLGVRWYLRYHLSYRDLEELLAERGIVVDHVTLYRWVARFTPLLIDAARFTRHAPGRQVVHRRDLRQGLREVDLPVPGGRPVRAGHRRAGLAQAGSVRRARVLSPCPAAGPPGAGDH
jgi:hypothetical protein